MTLDEFIEDLRKKRQYPIRTNCCKCHALIKETPCPFCGAKNRIEYGREFEEAKKEYDRYDEYE